jgi:hypothetical protein
MRAAGKGDVMLRKHGKGWIAAAALVALLLASVPASAGGLEPRDRESWIVRLAAWLGLPPSLTAAWEMDSAHIDPLGHPTADDSANIDPNGQPGATSDSSGYIDPDG